MMTFMKYEDGGVIVIVSVCRSRDVAVVKVTMNFEPNKVNIQKKNCRVEGKETVCINATVCFDVKLKSKEDTIFVAGKCLMCTKYFGARA